MLQIVGSDISFKSSEAVEIDFAYSEELETGEKVYFAIRSKCTGSVVDYEITDGTLVLNSDVTSTMRGEYEYEIRLVKSDNNKYYPLASGKITVSDVIK